MAKLLSDDRIPLKLTEALMAAEPASLHPGAANWGCHNCPPTVYRALFFTGGLRQLLGLTAAHIAPGNSCEVDPNGTCKIFVSTLVRGGGKKLSLVDQGRGLVSEKWAYSMKNKEILRRLQMKISGSQAEKALF